MNYSSIVSIIITSPSFNWLSFIVLYSLIFLPPHKKKNPFSKKFGSLSIIWFIIKLNFRLVLQLIAYLINWLFDLKCKVIASSESLVKTKTFLFSLFMLLLLIIDDNKGFLFISAIFDLLLFKFYYIIKIPIKW